MYSVLCLIEEYFGEMDYLSEYFNFKCTNFIDYKEDNKVDVILIQTQYSMLKSLQIAEKIKNNTNASIIYITEEITDENIGNFLIHGDDYVSIGFNKLDLLHKINTQIKIKTLAFKLEEERLYSDSMMASSSNLLFIQDNHKILKANTTFLNFFQIDTIEEFNDRYTSITEVFMEYENFYSKYILNQETDWLDKISCDKKSNEYKILIMDLKTFEPKAFQIHVTALNHSDKFLVTLTDITKITIKSKKFEIQATYDDLTKVFNRTKFNEILESEYNHWQKTKEPLSFALFDIDFFKIVNDEYGHIVGDETLLLFAQTINNAIRDGDIFARWGGEEFTLLLPNTNLDKTYNIVEKLRVMIENIKFKLINHKTCSIGISEFCENDSILDVITRADEALYEAKETGRNKVCIKKR